MSGDRGRLPVHLAFYWLGVGAQRPDGIVLRDEVGPYVEGLAEVFETVTVLVYEPPAQPVTPEDIAEYVLETPDRNVRLLSLGPKGSWKDLLQRRQRVGAIVREASVGWDVLLVRFDRRAHLVADANRCERTVAMVHGHSGAAVEPPPPVLQRLRRAPLSLRSNWHLRRIVRSSGLFVTDGEHYLSAYGRHAEKSALIRHSIRREKWSHSAADRLQGPTQRFLFVGRLSSMKGILETLESFAQIRAGLLPSAHLDVVGVGPDLDAARKLVESRGITDAVTFHGSLEPGEQLFGLYRDADVLLFLSRSESFPKVVLEALANSTLVVGTAVGALPLAFAPNREMMFVEPTPRSVVGAVETLLRDAALRRGMIEHGQRWGKETSLEAVVRRLAEAIVSRWPELAPSPSNHGGLSSRSEAGQ